MHAGRRPCRFTTWLAIAAFVAAALAPALSHAVALYRGASWADICSASAQRPAPGDDTIPLTQAFEHCGYCTLHLPSLDLPPPPALAAAPAHGVAAPRPPRPHAPPSPPWLRALPRGPPRG